MDFKEQLEVTQKKQHQVLTQIKQLDKQKQVLISEALRYDGEVRLLTRLSEDMAAAKQAAKDDKVVSDGCQKATRH